jgi:ABC-2 type transport system ATP-binding protein
VNGCAIETHGLRKRFGSTLAVADLSLCVRSGEVFGFLGPNGAGKTTSVKMLLALVDPSGGTARVLETSLGDRRVRARIGFLPEHFRFHDCLSARELLRFHGRLYGGRGRELEARIDMLLARVDLLDAADRPLHGYSKGMLQRTGLAQALINDPELVFLDEPTSGLDPLMDEVFRECIEQERRAGRTVLLSSHILAEVEALCDRVTIIRAGKTVETGSLSELRHLTRTSIAVETVEPAGDLATLPGIHDLDVTDHRARFDVDTTHLDEAVRHLTRFGIRSLTSQPPTLEELFLRHYGDRIEQEEETAA